MRNRINTILFWLVVVNVFPLNAQSISAVKSSLTESNNSLAALSVSTNINKWSKYKPVRGSWPISSNSRYAINPFANWSYTKPYHEYRLGDFRNYNPNARPPIYLDEDGSYEETELYPLGSPDHSEWKFVVNTSPADGELTCGDLWLSNDYIGFRVTIPGGAVYYKSYDEISTFNSKMITISAGLNSHALPYSFTNLPYGVGNFTLEFGFCTSQTTGWSKTNPGFYLLPDVTNDVNCINIYHFIVHDWIWLSNNNTGWLPGDLSYQESHIATSLNNWQIISKPSWVNVSVYQQGALVTNSMLWATDMDIRLSPTDNNNLSDRMGTVEIGYGTTVLATIGVFQPADLPYPPDAYVTTSGFEVSSSDANVSLNSTNLSYSLTPTNVGMNVFCSVQLKKNGVTIDTDMIMLKDNTHASGSFILSVPAASKEIYQIVISK